MSWSPALLMDIVCARGCGVVEHLTISRPVEYKAV
jgi:hypothetical protein